VDNETIRLIAESIIESRKNLYNETPRWIVDISTIIIDKLDKELTVGGLTSKKSINTESEEEAIICDYCKAEVESGSGLKLIWLCDSESKHYCGFGCLHRAMLGCDK
jgi:hypothetical protein